MGTESRSEYGHSPLPLSKWSGLWHVPVLECLLSFSFDSLLGFFLLEDFFKVLGFAGVVSVSCTGDEIDPLVKEGAGSGVMGAAGGGGGAGDGWLSITMSGARLSAKASSMHTGLEEAILGRFGRADSATSTLDFQAFWRRFGIYKKTDDTQEMQLIS